MIAYLLPYLPRLLGGLALAALLAFGVHRYNDWIRAPLRQQITFYEDSLAAQKRQAAALLAAKVAENAALAEKWTNYARETDDHYEKTIADIRASANFARGVRLYDPAGRGEGSGGSAAAGKDGAGSAETAAAARPLSAELAEFLVGEAARADEVAAYAQACHEFVNAK